MKLRTFDEMVRYYEEKKGTDFLGVIANDIFTYLPYEYANQYLKPEITKEQWDADVKELTIDAIKKEIKDYIPFAWDKANCERGISAGRSLLHFETWFFLIGDDAMQELMGGDYQNYGKSKLLAVDKWIKDNCN